MKRSHQIVVLFLLFIGSFSGFSQGTYSVFNHIDRSNRGSVTYGAGADKQGNIYLIANTYDTLWAETINGTEIIKSDDNNTYFLQKLDASGRLLWVKNLSLDGNKSAPKLFVSDNGEITLHLEQYNGNRSKDHCIRRYTTNGKLLWSTPFLKDVLYDNNCRIHQFILNEDQSICIAGSYSNYLVINGSADTLVSEDDYLTDSFILKLNSNAEFEWVATMGGYSSEDVDHLAMDSKGNVFFAGTYSYEFIMEGDTLKHGPDTDPIIFGKLNNLGEKEILKEYEGFYYGAINSLAIDNEGRIFIAGAFKGGYNIFDGSSNEDTRWDESIAYIAEFDTNLESVWLKTQQQGRKLRGGAIHFGEDNTLYLIGNVPEGVDFDASNVIRTFPITKTDRGGAFRLGVQKMTKDGEFLDLYLVTEPKFNSRMIWYLDYQTIVMSEKQPSGQVGEDRFQRTTVKVKKVDFVPNNPLNIRSCGSYLWAATGETYFKSGSYYANVTTAAQKDSALQLNLIIESLDNSVSHDDKRIYSNAKDVTYQWLDCENNYKPLKWETDSVFTFTDSGTYCVVIKSKFCNLVDTSECVSVAMTGIDPNDKERYYSIDFNYMVDKIEREHIQLNANEVKMIPFRTGPLYGFVKNGKPNKWFIDKRFEQVFAVYKEGAIVKDTAKELAYGLVNKKGKYLIPPHYENLFKENGIYHGINYHSKSPDLNRLGNNTYHYVHDYYDTKGKFLFREHAHHAESFFYEDYAWFRFGKTYYIYNKKGQLVKQFKVLRDRHFIGIADNKLLFNEDDERVVAYTIEDEVVFSLPIRGYQKVYQFTPNLFGILSSDADYYFCDSLGESKDYANTSNAIGLYQSDEGFFKQQQFVVRKKNTNAMGVIDRNEKQVLEFKYTYVSPLVNGYRYCIDTNQTILFVDEKGTALALEGINIPRMSYRNKRMTLVQVYGFCDGLAIASKRPPYSDSLAKLNPDEYYEAYEKSEYYYYYDTLGTVQLELSDTILLAGNFSDGLVPAVSRSKKLGFINKKGEWAIQPKYELSVAGGYPMPYLVIPYFENGFAYIKSFKGYIDKYGNEYFNGERMQDSYDFSH